MHISGTSFLMEAVEIIVTAVIVQSIANEVVISICY